MIATSDLVIRAALHSLVSHRRLQPTRRESAKFQASLQPMVVLLHWSLHAPRSSLLHPHLTSNPRGSLHVRSRQHHVQAGPACSACVLASERPELASKRSTDFADQRLLHLSDYLSFVRRHLVHETALEMRDGFTPLHHSRCCGIHSFMRQGDIA